MKSDMLQNAIGEIKDEYILEAIETNAVVDNKAIKAKKSRKMWKILAPSLAACCCLAIGVAVMPAFLQANAKDAVVGPEGERDIIYDEQYRDNLGEMNSDAETKEAKIASLYMGAENSVAQETKDFYQGVFLPYDTSVDKLETSDNGDSPKLKLISGSDGAFAIDDIAVNNGKVVYSGTLKKWVDLWPTTDIADPDDLFQVGIVLFKDGVQLEAGSEDELKECDRLFLDGDYEPTRVTWSDGEGNISHGFYIICTMDQLQNFPASKDLGYQLMLYAEYMYHFHGQIKEVVGDNPVTYNSAIVPEDKK